MRIEDKPKFLQLLANVMAGYGKPLPDTAMVNVWISMLMPFEPETIRAAFDAYAAERPDFVPAPNGIAARCKLLDGRPDENEAWAKSLPSRDQSESVVWTSEMSEAFEICRPVLDSGDEIGARMAFKDAYTRLVAASRAAGSPVMWYVSEGWDKRRKAAVIGSATRAGLLPAPPAHLMLESNSDMPAGRPEGLKRVLEEIAKLENPLEKLERLRLERVQAELEAEQKRTAELNNQVQQAGASILTPEQNLKLAQARGKSKNPAP
jgi:hypothetical protein